MTFIYLEEQEETRGCFLEEAAFDIGSEKITEIWAKEHSLQSRTPENFLATATKYYSTEGD